MGIASAPSSDRVKCCHLFVPRSTSKDKTRTRPFEPSLRRPSDDRVDGTQIGRVRVVGRDEAGRQAEGVERFARAERDGLGLLPGHCFGHPGFSGAIQNGQEVGTCLRVDANAPAGNPEWVRAVDESGQIQLLPPRANMFFGLYFIMTGLHGLHVLIGMSVLAWVLVKNMQGKFSPQYFTPVDLGALYWHLVDLVWIYLFPLLYLVGKPE